MTVLQRACMSAAVLWVGMHLWHAVAALEAHPHRPAAIAAMALCVAASAWAISPLATGSENLSATKAQILAAAGVAVAVLVTPFLDAQAVRSYANWPPGALGVLIAALVMRRRSEHASGVAACVCLLTLGSVNSDGLDLVWSVSLCIPPLLWLGATILVRRLFDRTASALDRYGVITARAKAEAELDASRETSASKRRSELEQHVVPLLRALSTTNGTTIAPELQGACAAMEAQLRDDLRGRYILTESLRTLLNQLRGVGTEVRIVDDRADPNHDASSAAARLTIEATLPMLGGSKVTYRVVPDGRMMTVIAEGNENVLKDVAALLGNLGEDALVDIEGSALYAECPL